jgi:hypothetical protein
MDKSINQSINQAQAYPDNNPQTMSIVAESPELFTRPSALVEEAQKLFQILTIKKQPLESMAWSSRKCMITSNPTTPEACKQADPELI